MKLPEVSRKLDLTAVGYEQIRSQVGGQCDRETSLLSVKGSVSRRERHAVGFVA